MKSNDRGGVPPRETRAAAPSVYDGFRTLSGKQVLDRVLDAHDAGRPVADLALQDFYWIVKRVGEDDALPLLQLASKEQWQYILDLGIWKKDRIAFADASSWVLRLLKADPERLAEWLLTEGHELTFYFLGKTLEVHAGGEEAGSAEIPPDAFTLDGVIRIRVRDPDLREPVEELVRWMAKKDYPRFHVLLLHLSGVLPAELEEEMYRLRNVRLAEQGFLPFEEAVSVYASLDPFLIEAEGRVSPEEIVSDEVVQGMVPALPLALARAENLFTEVTSRVTDPLFTDKIRLEFAGLCNQILSADGAAPEDLEVLIAVCRRAAAYLNLALEERFGRDLSGAQRCLRTQPLAAVFRVGFGLALRVRWEAEQWVRKSWFRGQGFDPSFWGEQWGARLAGILERRPKVFDAIWEEGRSRDFQHPSDVSACRELLDRLKGLDLLLSRLDDAQAPAARGMQREGLNFQSLLINFWARDRLGCGRSFAPISLGQARQFLSRLREKDRVPPFRMATHEEAFRDDLLKYGSGLSGRPLDLLADSLGRVWQEFRDEYAEVALEDLDPRFSRLIQITREAT